MDKIICEICGEHVHAMQLHLASDHIEVSLARYREIYPGAEILSDAAKRQIEKQKIKLSAVGEEESEIAETVPGAMTKQELRLVFGIKRSKQTLGASGSEIVISVGDAEGEFSDIIPEIDTKYIFQMDILKNVLMGLEMNIPTYLWGHAGTGKSSMFEQVCAFTKRPYIRIQHTANTEESHIVGQILANAEGTYFEPGPLALAMKHGWVYNADEYDFAHASILAVYQPILEGKSLLIKEAPIEWRVIKPHPNFRFVATGNTNGAGDESGLYVGTNMGNAANYSRFGITENVPYMPAKQEIKVISKQGGCLEEDAKRLVEFAGKIREAFNASKMSSTIGPRELIYAARVGFMKADFKAGVELAYINRMGTVDREVSLGIAQRIFGESDGSVKSSTHEFEAIFN